MAAGVTSLALAGRVGGRSHAVEADRYQEATRLLAQVAVVVVGVDLKVALGASAALPLAVVALPLWIGSIRRFQHATAVLALVPVAIVVGFLLSEHASVDHRVSLQAQVQGFALLLSGAAALALVLWARTLLPLHRVVVLYGAGALAGALMAGQTSWKFDLSVPTALVVLGLIEHTRHWFAGVVAVVALGVLGVFDDGRSFFALCLLAATVRLWQVRSLGGDGRLRRWYPALFMAAIGVVVYLLATAMLTGGYLGSDAQERSVQQIETSGSLLVGGRPEWAATIELVQLRPLGFGAGVVPSWDDVQAGRRGLDAVNVELESNRQAYMFGGQFKLHSVAADLWASYGPAGVALAVVMLVALVRSMSFAIAAGTLTTSVALAAILAIWFMFFGPIYTNWIGVCVGLGFVVLLRDDAVDDGAPALVEPRS